MLLYSDILSGDEMFSDAFPVFVHTRHIFRFQLIVLYRKLVDDIVFEVDCALIIVKAGADFDIGGFFVFPLSNLYSLLLAFLTL